MQLKPSALAGWSLFLLLTFLSVFLALAGLGTAVTAYPLSYIVIGGAEVLIFGIPTLLLKRYRPLRGLVNLRTKPASTLFSMHVLFTSLTIAILSFLLQCLVTLPQGRMPAGLSAWYRIPEGIPTGMVWFILGMLVLIAPAAEELFLRGAIFSLYEKRGTSTAVIMTALAYAMLQRDPEVLPAALAAGFGYGLLLYWTGSVWPVFFAHAVHNAYMMVLGEFALRYPLNAGWTYFVAGNAALLFLCAYVALRTLRNLVREGQIPRFDPGPGTFRLNLTGAAGNTGFLLFAAVFFVRMAVMIAARFT